jgi:hypothetical protein
MNNHENKIKKELIYLLILAFIIILILIFTNPENISFNQNIWLKSNEKRKEMITDLTQNVLRKKSKVEIIRLLGSPDKIYFKNADLVYLLGKEKKLFSIDYEWFLIYLDTNGKYSYYKIERD